MEDYSKCLQVAIKLAINAGELIKEAFKKEKKSEAKSSHADLVTETDKAVENYLNEQILIHFPEHRFIGEEMHYCTFAGGSKCRFDDDPTWIIDPVDGTMNFVHSFPYTAVSIALWHHREAQVAVIYNPILDQMFTAKKGSGAFLNSNRIHTSGQKNLKQALVIAEIGTDLSDAKVNVVMNNLKTLMPKVHGLRAMGSAALNMCHVAMGAADVSYEFGIHAWDTAAGKLIVEEAGGVVTDPNGSTFDLMARRVLCAATPELAESVAKLLMQYDGERD